MTNETTIFEVATRQKYRFPYKGIISVEDMWDLPVTALDSIFKTLNAKAKQAQEESLLESKTKEDEETAIKIQIVRHIVNVKQAEAVAREKAKENKEMKQRLLEIKATREDKRLEGLSDADLDKMIAEL